MASARQGRLTTCRPRGRGGGYQRTCSLAGDKMTYMDKALSSRITPHDNGAGTGQESREPLVVVVEDGISLSGHFE